MARFADSTPDLFAPPKPPSSPPPPEVDPVAELQAFLDRLCPLSEMPWRTISDAMQEEYRVLWLAKQAGPAWAALATAVHDQFERLLALTD